MKNINKILLGQITAGLYFLTQALKNVEASGSGIYWELTSLIFASIITTYGLYKIRETTATS